MNINVIRTFLRVTSNIKILNIYRNLQKSYVVYKFYKQLEKEKKKKGKKSNESREKFTKLVDLLLFLLFHLVVASSKEFHERNTCIRTYVYIVITKETLRHTRRRSEFFGIKEVSPVPLSLEIFSGRNVLFINTSKSRLVLRIKHRQTLPHSFFNNCRGQLLPFVGRMIVSQLVEAAIA